jgi:transcriptional regulator with XRE-family HTH domain
MGETFGELVKRLRNQAGLSQSRLANKSKLSTSFIAKLERDDRNKNAPTAIRSSTLELLADGLGLSEDSPDRKLLIDAASEQKRQRQLAREREVVSHFLGSREILETTQRTYVEPHDSSILLEVLRRSRENYPIRTKLHGTKIDWDDYHRKYPTVQEKISNDTWYAISDTGSFFGFMGTMIKYKYVNPDVLFDIVYIDKKLWYDNKDFTDNMRREYNEHLWEEWEYLIKLADKCDNKD